MFADAWEVVGFVVGAICSALAIVLFLLWLWEMFFNLLMHCIGIPSKGKVCGQRTEETTSTDSDGNEEKSTKYYVTVRFPRSVGGDAQEFATQEFQVSTFRYNQSPKQILYINSPNVFDAIAGQRPSSGFRARIRYSHCLCFDAAGVFLAFFSYLCAIAILGGIAFGVLRGWALRSVSDDDYMLAIGVLILTTSALLMICCVPLCRDRQDCQTLRKRPEENEKNDCQTFCYCTCYPKEEQEMDLSDKRYDNESVELKWNCTKCGKFESIGTDPCKDGDGSLCCEECFNKETMLDFEQMPSRTEEGEGMANCTGCGKYEAGMLKDSDGSRFCYECLATAI